jgi:hypothetical protein
VAIGNAGRPLAEALLVEALPGTSADAGWASLADPMVAEHISWARSQAR